MQVKTEQRSVTENLNNEEDYDFGDTFSYENNKTITSEHNSSAFHNLTLVSLYIKSWTQLVGTGGNSA